MVYFALFNHVLYGHSSILYLWNVNIPLGIFGFKTRLAGALTRRPETDGNVTGPASMQRPAGPTKNEYWGLVSIQVRGDAVCEGLEQQVTAGGAGVQHAADLSPRRLARPILATRSFVDSQPVSAAAFISADSP